MRFVGRMNPRNHTRGPIWAKMLTFTSTAELRTLCRIFLWRHLLKILHNIKRETSRAHYSWLSSHSHFLSGPGNLCQLCGWQTASLSAVGIFQLRERASLETISTLVLEKKKKEEKWKRMVEMMVMPQNRYFCFLFFWFNFLVLNCMFKIMSFLWFIKF